MEAARDMFGRMPTGGAPARGGAPGAGGPAGARGRLSRDQFARLYEQSWRVLWCAAVSVISDRTQAQDVVQQSAVIALENLDDFDPETSFLAWMSRIVRNTALNEARKRSRRRTGLADSATLDAGPTRRDDGPDPRPIITGRGQPLPDQQAFDDEVATALDDLDEVARGCLLMRTVLDMAYKDIALALDIPEGTAASHVHRARKALRDRLQTAAVAEPHLRRPA